MVAKQVSYRVEVVEREMKILERLKHVSTLAHSHTRSPEVTSDARAAILTPDFGQPNVVYLEAFYPEQDPNQPS